MQDGLGARGDGGLDGFGTKLEAIFGAAGDFHRHAARQHHLRLVGDKAGRGDDDFVARVEQGGHGQVQGFGYAHADDELRLRVVGHAVQAVQVRRKRLAQLQAPGVGGVVRLPAVEGTDARLQNVLRGLEIRLADAQRDDIVHGGNDVEKAADAGRLERQNTIGKVSLVQAVSSSCCEAEILVESCSTRHPSCASS